MRSRILRLWSPRPSSARSMRTSAKAIKAATMSADPPGKAIRARPGGTPRSAPAAPAAFVVQPSNGTCSSMASTSAGRSSSNVISDGERGGASLMTRLLACFAQRGNGGADGVGRARTRYNLGVVGRQDATVARADLDRTERRAILTIDDAERRRLIVAAKIFRTPLAKPDDQRKEIASFRREPVLDL